MSLTNEPLTEEQKELPSGMILPSGEANFYDFAQSHEYNSGSGINYPFGAGPDVPASDSGLLATYGPDGQPVDTKSVIAADKLNLPNSNAQDVVADQITDFTIFNNYIHYDGTGSGNNAITIPFLSTYTLSSGFDPYSIEGN